jgi:hypothetical protein
METLEYYYRNPNKLKSDFRMHSENDFESQPEDKRKIDFDWAKKVIALIHPYLEDKDVEKKPVDEEISSKKPITFKSRKNDLFYITFKFDDNERLSSVDNKWDIGFPDWWGLEVPETDIINFFRRKYPEFYLVDNSLNEVAVIEDKVVDKKTEDEISKKSDDKGVREKNLQKIAGLINKKFHKQDIDKLINLLENKKEETEFSTEEKQKIKDFVANYKGNFKDEDIHSFSDKLGLDKHEVEEFIYGIARKELKR